MLARQNLPLACGLMLGVLLAHAPVLRGDHPSEAWSGPACGKVCKLVCEKTKLPAVGYGYKCDTICIPGPSKRGCKHCDTTCCGADDIEGCNPEIEFCWYDWFACGCAKPRTVRLLTKYQAEKQVGSYHWEVVDASCCDCVSLDGTPSKDGNIYKPAPADAELGDVLAVSDEEWVRLAPQATPGESGPASQVAEQTMPAAVIPEAEPPRVSIAEKLREIFRK
jgi:hypothetical protein